jgi:membrane protein insertase Oxa1/YidC/SpoIIIJ
MITSALIDPVRVVLFAAAHVFGGNLGAGILAVSFGVRLAFLPLTLRWARRAEAQRRILEGIKAEVAELEKRYAAQPVRFIQKRQELYDKAGYKQIDREAVLGGFARWPFVAGIYGALRSIRPLGSFAWIKDLASPNAGLTLLIAAASSTAAYLTSRVPGNERAALASVMIGSAISVAILWHLSSAVALSWAANTAGDLIQSVVLVRERRTILRASSRTG